MPTNNTASAHGASIVLTKWGLNNLPLPTSGVQDAPLVAVLINSAWSEVLLSALTVLEESKTWADGADTERAELQTYFLYDQIRQAMALTTANISDFSESVDDRIAALLTAGNKISLSYNDAGNTLTIAFTGLTSLSELPAINKGVLLGTAPGTGTATPQEITIGSNLALSGAVLNAAVYYPLLVNIFQDAANFTNGSPAKFITSSQVYNYYVYVPTAANGNVFEHYFVIAAGSYSISMIGVTAASGAKLDWYLDGTLIASGQDWYSAATIFNVVKTIGTVNITQPGQHTLRAVVNGRNVSANDWRSFLTKITISPNTSVMP